MFIYESFLCRLSQSMVCMYLIDAYCCDTEWKHCFDGGIKGMSYCSSTVTTTVWSQFTYNEQGTISWISRYTH